VSAVELTKTQRKVIDLLFRAFQLVEDDFVEERIGECLGEILQAFADADYDVSDFALGAN